VNGSISTWTYETARQLARDCTLLLIEFGDQSFGTHILEYEGIVYAYVPNAINRTINRVHGYLARVSRLFQSAARSAFRPSYASTFHNFGYIVQAAWRARCWRSDVVHIHNFSQFVPIVRLFNPNARIVLHMHCEWLSQHDPAMIAGRAARADAIACCSEHIRRMLLEAHPVLRNKLHVVYNGADVDEFLPSEYVVTNGAAQQMHILFVGRLSPEKGVHILVEAFANVARSFPQASLELVGNPGSLPPEFLVGLSRDPLVRSLGRFSQTDYLANIKSRIPEDLCHRIVFHGSIPHDHVAEHFRKATIFVCPSYSDAFPLPVVEAMAAGLPVVASAVGGIPEAIVQDETGILVQPDSVDALANALKQVLGDEDRRKRMSTNGRARALKLFSWKEVSKQIARVYFDDQGRIRRD
jgi:glycosyltransferase involved in cell wall biosynthesis